MGIQGADQEWATDSLPSLGLLLPSDPTPDPSVVPLGWAPGLGGPSRDFPK